MAESNVVAKLKESFASGTEKRAATKKISGNAMTVGVVVAVIGIFISVVNWLASKSDDGFLNLLIILALAISIYGLKFSTGAAKYYTQIVGIGILVALAMYLVYGSYAPTVFKDWQADFVQSHKDRMAQKTPSSASAGTPRSAEVVKDVTVKRVVVQWTGIKNGSVPVGVNSVAWEKPNTGCTYASSPGIGRWYEFALCEVCEAEKIPTDEREFPLTRYEKVFFRMTIPGKSGLEVIEVCPAS